MATPKIVDRKPKRIDLEPGKHAWCSCGLSKTQPFCDGSHRKTAFKPVVFNIEEPQEAYLCMCKHTQSPPYCDGTHKSLPEEEEEEEEEADSKGNRTESASTPEEPTLNMIHTLAREGLEATGHHGEMGAMGVPRPTLPSWDDIQFRTAQLATKPLLEEAATSATESGNAESNQPEADAAGQTNFVGSRNSAIFHRASCSHAKRIKPDNIVRFDAARDARSQGRTPCRTCKPPM